MPEFATAFKDADYLVLSDIYAASEKPIPGVTSQALTEAIRKTGHQQVYYGGKLQDATQLIAKAAQPGDILITLGAGAITKSAPQILELL